MAEPNYKGQNTSYIAHSAPFLSGLKTTLFE